MRALRNRGPRTYESKHHDQEGKSVNCSRTSMWLSLWHSVSYKPMSHNKVERPRLELSWGETPCFLHIPGKVGNKEGFLEDSKDQGLAMRITRRRGENGRRSKEVAASSGASSIAFYHLPSIALASFAFPSFNTFYHLLVRPLEARVQEWPQVEPIVLRTISLGVIAGCQYRHLVAIDGVEIEEPADLLVDLPRC